ncbi:MAG: hypothetical protein L3J00_00785 [Thiomicrorhabdus sp.]|nr:hypothetical protein [Thiomicrorhabdus sp.]
MFKFDIFSPPPCQTDHYTGWFLDLKPYLRASPFFSFYFRSRYAKAISAIGLL